MAGEKGTGSSGNTGTGSTTSSNKPPGPVIYKEPPVETGKEKGGAPPTPAGKTGFGEKEVKQQPVAIPQQKKESTEIPVVVTAQEYLDPNFVALNVVVADFDPKEVFDSVDNKVEELLESPKYKERAENLGITHASIMMQLLVVKKLEEKEEESKEVLEGIMEKKERIEGAEVREHKGFVEEKIQKEAAGREGEKARVTEEILDKAINDVVGRHIRPEEEIVDRTTELHEEITESGLRQTVEVITEIRGGEVRERRRVVSKAEDFVEKIKQSEPFVGEMERITEIAKDKGTTKEKIYEEMNRVAEATPNPEIMALASRMEKPGAGPQEKLRIVKEIEQKERQFEQVKNALSELEKVKAKKLEKDAAIEETRKRVQERSEKNLKERKEIGDILREIKNLTIVGVQELEKRKDEILKEKPDLQKAVAGKRVEDIPNTLNKRISDSVKTEERIKKLEDERERISPEELRKRLTELFKEDKKTQEEMKLIKDAEIAEYAKKKLNEKLEEGKGKRKDIEDTIKKVQEATASTIKEFRGKVKESIKNPELLKEIEGKQAGEVVEYLEKKLEKLRQTGGNLEAVSQKMEEFNKRIDGTKQKIMDIFKEFARKQPAPGDLEAIDKINELKGLKGIEFAKEYSKKKLISADVEAKFWKQAHEELSKCLEDPSLAKQFSEKVKEMALKEPKEMGPKESKFSRILGERPPEKEIVSLVKGFEDASNKKLEEWKRVQRETGSILDELYRKWDETAKFIEGIKSPVKGIMKISKEGIGMEEAQKYDRDAKFLENVSKQIKELKAKPEEFFKKLDESLRSRSDIQKEITEKLVGDMLDISKKKASEYKKEEEKIRTLEKTLEKEIEKIKPQELRKEMNELFGEDQKTLDEIGKVKDNELVGYAKKKLKERNDESQIKRKGLDDVIGELQKGEIATIKEINDKIKEKIKGPELLKETRIEQIERIIEYVGGRIEKLTKQATLSEGIKIVDKETVEKFLGVSQKEIAKCNKDTRLWNSVLEQVRELKDKPEELIANLEVLLKGKPGELQHIRKLLSTGGAEQYLQDKADETANPYLEMIKNTVGLYPSMDSGKLFEKLGYKIEEIESAEKTWKGVKSIISSGKSDAEIAVDLRKLAGRKDLTHRAKMKILNRLSHLTGLAGEKRVNEIKKMFYADKLISEIVNKSGFSKALSDKNYKSVDKIAGKIAAMADGIENLNKKIIDIRSSTENKEKRKEKLVKIIAEIYKEIIRKNRSMQA